MQTVIYYYTATGNSLVLARKVAQALGDAEVLPLAPYRKDGAAPAAERVGIVFPVHAWGPPRTVSEFIGKLDLRGARYVFAIACCGGTAAGTLLKMRRAIRKRGGELHAGYIVRSAGYMVSNGEEAPMIALVRRWSGKLFPTAEERLPEIVEAVRAAKKHRPERNALVGTLLGNFFHGQAQKAFAGMDKGYKLHDVCQGCGTCTRICPRGNVTLENGKPSWHHDCDFCGACATWCARSAIGFNGMPASPRKHNPQVRAADVIWAHGTPA